MKDKIIDAFGAVAEKFKDFAEGKVTEIMVIYAEDDYALATAVRSAMSGEAPVKLVNADSVSGDDDPPVAIVKGTMAILEVRKGGALSGPMITQKVVKFA